MKRLLITISFLLMLACNELNSLFPALPVKDEEYAVLSALIQDLFIGLRPPKLIVINALTISQAEADEYADRALNRLSGEVPDQAIVNFRAANTEPLALERRFTLSVPYEFMSREEGAALFKDNDGWQRFYEKYPDSRGIIALSRPGLNTAMDIALVYVGSQSGWLSGYGRLVVLKKIDDQWVVQKLEELWIS